MTDFSAEARALIDKFPNRPYYRRSLTPKRRKQIVNRDNGTCQYCGTKKPSVRFEVDHIIPCGISEPFNLVLSCNDCNRSKSHSVWLPKNLHEITKNHLEWRQLVERLANTSVA